MLPRWQAIRRIHRSIAVLAATLIGVVTTIMLLCAAALLIRFGGDDDGTWAAADVADALKEAVTRDGQGHLLIKQTARLQKFSSEFPAFWYVVSDQAEEVSFGPVPEWRPPKNPSQRNGPSFVAYAIEGDKTHLRRMMTVRNTPVGEVWIETGGVAYTASQLMLGTLTDATFIALPILLVLAATAFAALVFVPMLIARPVRAVARAAERIDGLPNGSSLPEEGAPAELLPLISAFNRALYRIDVASKAQRSFLSNAAHELRTPLTNMRTTLEEIQDTALRARLIAENQKLSSTVTMLLQLARISMESTEVTRIDLVALARKVAAEHVPMALKYRSDISFAAPSGSIWVHGSETAITVAVSNLIRNAVFHARSDQSIVVKVDHPAKLSVIDSGPGLRSNELEVLFEPFKRGDSKADGTGLGLAIVAQVMTAHHGSIAVRETPGGGTTVDLNFSAEGTAMVSCPNRSTLISQGL